MKQLKKLGLIALATATFLGCKKDKPITPAMALTPVYVESGEIKNDTLYLTNGAFDANQPALGLIDSTNCVRTINGYVDKTGWVYVFEGGKVPTKALKETEFSRFESLTNANWQNDKLYNLKLDAEICAIKAEWKLYIREKGDYQRQKAVIYNTNVYRFKNRYIIEDYKNFLDYHEYLRPAAKSPDLFQELKLSREQYRATFNGAAFNGTTNYAATGVAFTPLGQTDKIYFDNISGGNVRYRFRHVYIKHSPAIIRDFFDGNRVKPEYRRGTEEANKNNKWFNYLKTLQAKYVEPGTKGYECTACGSAKARKINAESLDSPPLPKIGNGS